MEKPVALRAKHIVIAGISTGVGKTIASAALLQRCGGEYWKPVQSGREEGTDTETVKQLVTRADVVFHPERYSFAAPLSPHRAAALENLEIDPKELVPPASTKSLFIETAGGLMSPLRKDYLNLDFICSLENPQVILIIAHYLGSLNHTLLSVEALRRRNLHIAGLLFCGPEDLPSETFLLEYTRLPFLGHIRQMNPLNAVALEAEAARLNLEIQNLP